MAVNGQVDRHALPCGRSVEDVADHLDHDVLDGHEVTCEHCRTARLSLENLWDATRALLEDPTEPPTGLVDRIMQAVRADVRRREVLVLPSAYGPADVSTRATAAVLRYAADSVPGVRARSCRITADPARNTAVAVRMTLSLRYGAGPAEQLLSEVRARINAALAGQVGLVADPVDLVIVDIWVEETS